MNLMSGAIAKENASDSKSPGTRLIDLGMMYHESSVAGLTERYGRGETSHTIHTWWARRPHSAMRALVFASLCKANSAESYEILENLLNSSSPGWRDCVERAKNVLREGYDQRPKVLDMFGGGGTIPFEAALLGAEVCSIDSNQLAVFIQKCNLNYSQRVCNDIKGLLKEAGERVLTRLKAETDVIFPSRSMVKAPYIFFWTYSKECEECGFKFYLSKRSWISKKKDKRIAFVIKKNSGGQRFKIENVDDDYGLASVWLGRNGKVKCPKCESIFDANIKDCKDEIVAVARPREKTGKIFELVNPELIPSSDVLDDVEEKVLNELEISLPSSEAPQWSGIVNPALYGIQKHSDVLNKRQRTVLLILIKQLRDEYVFLTSKYSADEANYIIGLLSSLIDQLVDWNCRLCMWIPQNEQVGRAFCGPGVSMYWDYVETDPLLNGPANLWDKLKRILSGFDSIIKFDSLPSVSHGRAQALRFDDNSFDAIITDPPYYDNIYYTVLADYFYVWKKVLLSSIDRNLFIEETTDSKNELVSSRFRFGSEAHSVYCNQLALAVKEASRVLKPDGLFSFVYSHSSLLGWEAIVRSFRPTDLIITSVQPLSIERKQRPRAMTSEAINTCMVLVAHKVLCQKDNVSVSDLCVSAKNLCKTFGKSLLDLGWNQFDVGLAVFANVIAMLANSRSVLYADKTLSDMDAMIEVEAVIQKHFKEFKLTQRKSL